MSEVAGWIAPVATMIAAMMTAANLGARFTGWGFVVFLVGSLAWSAVGATTGQTNLLATNAFLTLVNLVGVWRWLGRQATYEKSGETAAAAGPLTPLGGIVGATLTDRDGESVGPVVEAMAECDGLRLNYVVVSVGGIGGVGETLKAVSRRDLRFGETLRTTLTAARIDALPPVEKDRWPPAL